MQVSPSLKHPHFSLCEMSAGLNPMDVTQPAALLRHGGSCCWEETHNQRSSPNNIPKLLGNIFLNFSSLTNARIWKISSGQSLL